MLNLNLKFKIIKTDEGMSIKGMNKMVENI